jgi:hypothetical protein
VVRKEVPGIDVFGGISLDLTVGGVNPAAVEWMTKVKGGYGKVVWMPTFDSEHQVTSGGLGIHLQVHRFPYGKNTHAALR